MSSKPKLKESSRGGNSENSLTRATQEAIGRAKKKRRSISVKRLDEFIRDHFSLKKDTIATFSTKKIGADGCCTIVTIGNPPKSISSDQETCEEAGKILGWKGKSYWDSGPC